MIGEEKSPVSVATLSPKKQLAFALFVLERMLPSLIGGWRRLRRCLHFSSGESKLAIKPDTTIPFRPTNKNRVCRVFRVSGFDDSDPDTA
jgi:hypothetical protein